MQNRINNLGEYVIDRSVEIRNGQYGKWNYQKDKDKSYILDKTLVSPEYYEAYYDYSIRFSDNKSLTDEELIECLTK